MKGVFVLLMIHLQSAFGQVPTLAQSLQLQQLVARSEQQVELLKQLLTGSQRDSTSLDRAAQVLSQLSAGLDESIAKYQKTDVYAKALLELQTRNGYAKTFSDSAEVRALGPRNGESQKSQDQAFSDLKEFQMKSVKANEVDLIQQVELEKALANAAPGFIPKIQAQAELGSWKANNRMSSQLTELLSDMHAIREELRLLRQKQERGHGLDTLILGSEFLNRQSGNRREPK